jgi:hypothetical protein
MWPRSPPARVLIIRTESPLHVIHVIERVLSRKRRPGVLAWHMWDHVDALVFGRHDLVDLLLRFRERGGIPCRAAGWDTMPGGIPAFS